MDKHFVRFGGSLSLWKFVFVKEGSACAGAGVGGRYERNSLCLKIKSHKAPDQFNTAGFTFIAGVTAISIQTL